MIVKYSLKDSEALKAACPVCLARPEEPCRSVDMRRPGVATSWLHAGRIQAAKGSAN